ncbi:MAG: hypothetical protein JST73_01715 [Actinobacteria bacterium]|nr:hypothetical protein [Actinomycetota bacterium]
MRDELDAHGWSWIDRRGHIKVRHGSILIDADIPPLPKVPNGLQPADPFAGRAALTVALLALETHPDPLGGIRATARAIGTAPTTASTAIKRLIEAGLLGRDHRAVVPDLFWALTDHWHLPAIGLATTPDVPVEGVVLVGSHAAAALHAPAVTTENHPLELLAADDATARRILRRCGSAPIADAVAYLSIAPTPLSAAPTDRHVRGIPLAAPIVIALGLATDSARGAEIVRNWDWPGRVW